MSSSAESAQHRTWDFIDTTLTEANILELDGTTTAKGIWWYAEPPYPLSRVFYGGKDYDYIISIGEPTSEAEVAGNGKIIGYLENIPLEISAVDKGSIINAAQMIWNVEKEFRRILEANFAYRYGTVGTLRSIGGTKPASEWMNNAWKLYKMKYILSYERDVS